MTSPKPSVFQRPRSHVKRVRAWCTSFPGQPSTWLEAGFRVVFWSSWASRSCRSGAAARRGVTGIPATFLVDPEGILIAKGLRGDEIKPAVEEALREAFGEKP